MDGSLLSDEKTAAKIFLIKPSLTVGMKRDGDGLRRMGRRLRFADDLPYDIQGIPFSCQRITT